MIILKNNRPKYLLAEFNKAMEHQAAPDEDVMAISELFIFKRFYGNYIQRQIIKYLPIYIIR